MAMAMVYPEGRKGKKVVASSNNFERTHLSRARSVLRYSMPLAQEVMSGKSTLNDAVEVVRQHELRREHRGLLG